MDFIPPTQDEIVEVLRAHPLIRLRERVKRAFLVGSFAKGLARPRGSIEGESDVDILLEVLPRRGFTASDLEEKYRTLLRQFFMARGIRGKADDVHPQWDGRRVDLYFTYDADSEPRPKVLLAEEAGSFGVWGREEFKFVGTAEIIDTVREIDPGGIAFDPGEEENRDLRWRSVIWGQKVRWAAAKGKMVAIPRANVLFMEGNQWNLEHAAAIYQYMREGDGSPIRLPAARVYRVSAADVKSSEEYEAEGELEEQLGMTEPWEPSDVGSYYGQLIDGNHRAAAALALGEPFIWVYVAENSLENVRKKDLR